MPTDLADILDALAAGARRIPGLVADCGGSPEAIRALVDTYPRTRALTAELLDQEPGSVLFALEGVDPAGEGAYWRIRWVAGLRPGVEGGAERGGAFRMFERLRSGQVKAEGDGPLEARADVGRWREISLLPALEPVSELRMERRPAAQGASEMEVFLVRGSVWDRAR